MIAPRVAETPTCRLDWTAPSLASVRDSRICTHRCRSAAESFATGHGSSAQYRHCRTG